MKSTVRSGFFTLLLACAGVSTASPQDVPANEPPTDFLTFVSGAVPVSPGQSADELARGLKGESEANPNIAITVIGHTTSEGSDAYNRDLSLRRSVAVINALVDLGIAADLLSPGGRGEDDPIADNATEAGRSLNRRVEIQCR